LDANKRKHSPVDGIACPTSFNLTFVLTDSFPYDLFGTYSGVEVVIGESPQAQNLERVENRNHNQLSLFARVRPGDLINTIDKHARGKQKPNLG
jgi:hypothetical protein